MATIPAPPDRDNVPIGSFIKFVAWAAFVGALFLCTFDFATSVIGIRIVLGERDDDFIAFCMPIVFALLAICFNGLSAFMFRMFMRQGFSTFATSVTCVMWMCFVAYDFASSFIGMLATYCPSVRVNSWPAIMEAMSQLGAAPSFFVIIFALLLSFGPFLACMFYQLATSSD